MTMKNERVSDLFYKSLMSGLFTGMIITTLNLVYNFIYRDVTNFSPSSFVNVTSIIFVSILVSLVAGLIYFFIVAYAKKTSILYNLLFLVLTAFVTYVAFTVHRSADARVSDQFHGLFAGIVIITGLTDALLIPYFVTHRNAIF